MTTTDSKRVIIHTDGACSGNPGPGGWGAILEFNGTTKELFGGVPDTTNNRMELTAAIEGLRALKSPCVVEIHTDSEYLRNGITKWIHGWREKRLEDRRQEAGQERRALAGAGRSDREASGLMALGARPFRP